MRIYIETISLLELQIRLGNRLMTQTYDEAEFNKKVKPFLEKDKEYTDDALAEIARDKGCFFIRREWPKKPTNIPDESPRGSYGWSEPTMDYGIRRRDWSDQSSVY